MSTPRLNQELVEDQKAINVLKELKYDLTW